MKLNLGCGRDIKEGYVNLDFVKGKGVDVVWDMDNFPYPLEDNKFDEVNYVNIMEHLLYPDKAIREIYRVSKNNAIINIRTPHYSHPGIWWDLTHRRGFCWTSFDHYIVEKKVSNSLIEKEKVLFDILYREIEFSRMGKITGIRYLANKFPNIYECFFSYIFPARDIIYKLKVVKGK